MSKQYIERENFCKNICLCNEEDCNKERCSIYTAPTADVVEVKPFVETAQFAIKATDSADNYSSGFRNGIRYCLALIEGKEPEYETLKGAKPVEKFPFYNCPSCNSVVSEHKKYCSNCGQALDWNENVT